MKRKNKKTKGKRRSIHQTIETPKTNYAELAQKSEEMRRDRIRREAASPGGTRETFFFDTMEAWDRIDRNWRKDYLCKPKTPSCPRFHYYQALASSFAREYDSSGIVMTGFDKHLFSPINSSEWKGIAECGFTDKLGVSRDGSALITELAGDFEALGYRVVVVATPFMEEDGEMNTSWMMQIVDGDIEKYDYKNPENAVRLYYHFSQILAANGDDIRISPVLSYNELLRKAIVSYNRRNRSNPVHNPSRLSFEAIKRIVMNYLRHECTHYDDVWKSCQDRVDLLHRIFRIRVNRAIDTAYPGLDDYLQKVVSRKPKKASKSAAA